MLALLVFISLQRMQNRQQQLFESATHRRRINILLHGMGQCPSRDPQTYCWNAQTEGEVGIRARGTEHRRPQMQVFADVVEPMAQGVIRGERRGWPLSNDTAGDLDARILLDLV